MPRYNDRDLAEAENLIDAFLSRRTDVAGGTPNLVLADVEIETTEFANELDLLKDFNAPAYALRVAGDVMIPVAMSLIVGDYWPKLAHSVGPPRLWYHELFFEYYLRSDRKPLASVNGLEPISLEQAQASFRSLATAFLATRIATVRDFGAQFGNATLQMLKRAGSPGRVPTPGCNFTVSTNTGGLRVFWSGAYRISPNYFGSPTTPTSSVLQSGTYVFGVDGGAYGSVVQWDTAVVALPSTPAVHLNY